MTGLAKRTASMASVAGVVLRVLAALAVVSATTYAIERSVWRPFRCAGIVSSASAALAAAEQRSDHDYRRTARDVRSKLQRCECVSDALEVRTSFALAESATALGDHHAAITAYEHALTTDRRPELYFALGMAHLDALNRTAALDNLTRACAFDPARLNDIPYADLREETARRVSAIGLRSGSSGR